MQVGLPYARARAQDYYERLGGRRGDGESSDEPAGEAVTNVSVVLLILSSGAVHQAKPDAYHFTSRYA